VGVAARQKGYRTQKRRNLLSPHALAIALSMSVSINGLDAFRHRLMDWTWMYNGVWTGLVGVVYFFNTIL